MTDKEQITEVTKIINRRCEAELGQVYANSKDGKVTKTVDTSLIAKDIISAGYRKESETAKKILQPIYELCKVRKNIQWDDVYFLFIDTVWR